MERRFIIAVRNAIIPIVAEQIKEITKTRLIKLDPTDLAIKETDSSMTRKIKTATLQRLEANEELLAGHAVNMIAASIEQENQLVEEARKLRREANELLDRARKTHNAREYLIHESKSLPLALELNAVGSENLREVTDHVKTLEIPDYFAASKYKDVAVAEPAA